MSTPCTTGTPTSRTLAFSVVPMAIMVDGHSWSSTTGSRKGSKVTNIFEDLEIKRITSSLYHPSANGQAESTNKMIIQNFKKKLEDVKGKWPEELPGVLWACQTTAKLSIGQSLFSLVYGAKL
nr:uncharacterized protein LOC104086388 [Nicotiana tomentosiformis]